MDTDISQQLQQHVLDAAARGSGLNITGGNSKAFYGRVPQGETLEISGHQGITNYEPTELVLTARSGTPLAEVEATLAEQGQTLPFEPPHFGAAATLGGAIASGLSGPRRPYTGSARDYVLGIKIINGRGERLHFGGEVMKNVAGYDVSRLMTGAMGTLGVILEVSLKVLPKPAEEVTLVQQRTLDDALEIMNNWAGKPIPLSGACYDGDKLFIRLSGAASAVQKGQQHIGGDKVDDDTFWQQLREQTQTFFSNPEPLWRFSLLSTTPHLNLPGQWLIDWGGAQRWLKSNAEASSIYQAALEVGGHATLFRGSDRNGEVFQPLPPVLMALHRNLKQAFDPHGIFNPGRMYRKL